MHYVTALNYYELIQVLVENGANINIQSSTNNITPLVIAAAKGHEKCVKWLIRLGAHFWHDSEEVESSITPNQNESDEESEDSFSELESENSYLSRGQRSVKSFLSRDDDPLGLAL